MTTEAKPLTAADIESMRARMPAVPGAIAMLREAWRNDGAEGESVHLVCDAAEYLLSEVERLTTELKLERAKWWGA